MKPSNEEIEKTYRKFYKDNNKTNICPEIGLLFFFLMICAAIYFNL